MFDFGIQSVWQGKVCPGGRLYWMIWFRDGSIAFRTASGAIAWSKERLCAA
jgi:hypothetical protein